MTFFSLQSLGERSNSRKPSWSLLRITATAAVGVPIQVMMCIASRKCAAGCSQGTNDTPPHRNTRHNVGQRRQIVKTDQESQTRTDGPGH